MKKSLSILMVIVILATSLVSYASMEDKLGNHWSKDHIKTEFLTFYFPYLGRENFKRLDPRGTITNKDITASLVSLGKDHGLEVKLDGLLNESPLTREEIVVKIGELIKNVNLLRGPKRELPFNDISGMTPKSKEALELLYDLKIINGINASEFGPKRRLSQAEAIIILQRLDEALKNIEVIKYETMGIMQSYTGEESVKMKNTDDKVILTITKKFPTPGYSLAIDKIMAVEEGYKVLLKSTPPAGDSIQLQVITYKTITIEIDKGQLKQEEPYRFIVDGDNFPSGI